MFNPVRHLLQKDFRTVGSSEIFSDIEMQHICKPVRFKTRLTFQSEESSMGNLDVGIGIDHTQIAKIIGCRR